MKGMENTQVHQVVSEQCTKIINFKKHFKITYLPSSPVLTLDAWKSTIFWKMGGTI